MTEHTLSTTRAGIALGSVFGIIHLLWVGAVATGFGSQLITALETMHFIAPTTLTAGYTTTSASLLTAVGGVAGAAVIGYLLGALFAWSYNYASRFQD